MMKKLFALALMFLLISSCGDIVEKFKRKGRDAQKEKEKNAVVINENSFNGIEKGDSGTMKWLRYPAISPDGSEIAFSFMGDIYIASSEGGFARTLTTSPDHESNPVWSNDGKTIAFSSSRFGSHDVFTISKNGGTSKRLTSHSAPDIPYAFSPDNSKVYFSSPRFGTKESSAFPTRGMPQLYSVSVNGGSDILEIPLPVFDLSISKDGKRFIYHDKKGYESEWRKHHVSSVTRDIWEYFPEEKRFNRLTAFNGEDRSPVFDPSGSGFYYLSEKSGSFNIWKNDSTGTKTQITSFDTHPVRFLSVSNNGTLCFSYHGDIYTVKEGQKPSKIEIFSTAEIRKNELRTMLSKVSEIALSPDGTETAMILRGEIYAVNHETGTTKRITHTSNEERWVSFHPEGRKLLYSSFRNGSWNVYESILEDDDELYFFASTKITEKPLIANEYNTFQASYSPDGKKIAYLKERTELVVYDIDKNVHTTVLPKEKNVSYIDGDQEFVWSPDSSRIAVLFLDRDRWSGEIGIVDAAGRENVINITNSGTDDSGPVWNSSGDTLSWKNRGDILGFSLNKAAYDLMLLSKEENDLRKKLEEKNEAKKQKKTGIVKNETDKTKEAGKKDKKIEPVKFEKDDIDGRIRKLSLNPASYINYTFSADGETLYFLSMEPAEYKVVSISLREKKDKVIASIPRPRNMSYWYKPNFSLMLDKTGSNIFVLADGKVTRISVADGKIKPVAPAAEFSTDLFKEKKYLFDHVWKTVNDKFYSNEMHKVDWQKYYNEYVQMLPYISNNFDFTELLSEMLGELNVSHTGSGYIFNKHMGDSSGRLGIFFSLNSKGIVVEEIMKGSPLDRFDSRVVQGTVIEKIDGKSTAENDINMLLNRSEGKNVRISLFDPMTSNRWDETVKPVSYRGEFELLYKRWVERNRERVEKLSEGRLGYVHIRGMNGDSFISIYNDILGRYSDREGIVIDTRFNGGGWLHNELSVLFSGKNYTRYSHRGLKNFGGDPTDQWTKKSILIVNEGNYSDAHLFPFAYKTLKLGKIVGMPVAGTSTAVWWPAMLDTTMYFGIPQIGISDTDGNYLENRQLEPDYIVPILPEQYIKGEDPQIEKAVKVLLEAAPDN